MSEFVRFHGVPVAGLDAMTASTARAFPRHTHDQYGIGVVDAGAHSSWSGRGQVEAAAGSLISVNPGEVHDGRAVGGRPRAWRILYVDPPLLDSACADVLDGARASFAFAAPAFADERARGCFDAAFARATADRREGMAYQLIRGFARELGLTPHAYILQRRVALARRLIRARRALAEAAVLAGFYDQGHLTRCFVRQFGVTPRRYAHGSG